MCAVIDVGNIRTIAATRRVGCRHPDYGLPTPTGSESLPPVAALPRRAIAARIGTALSTGMGRLGLGVRPDFNFCGC